jgi:hypothetical protein
MHHWSHLQIENDMWEEAARRPLSAFDHILACCRQENGARRVFEARMFEPIYGSAVAADRFISEELAH